LVPNLEHLEIRSYPGGREEKVFNPDMFFGIVPGYNLAFVPGFAKLKSLTSSLILPWSVVTMPTLNILEYDFQYYDWGGLFASSHPAHEAITPCSNITTLILNLDNRFMEAFEETEELHGHIQHLLMHFTAIQKLHVRIFYHLDPEDVRSERWTVDTHFVHLCQVLIKGNTQEFVVDRSDMGILQGLEQDPFPLVPDRFPDLRRLVLPQLQQQKMSTTPFHHRDRRDHRLDATAESMGGGFAKQFGQIPSSEAHCALVRP
jgi:hypothetical protein